MTTLPLSGPSSAQCRPAVALPVLSGHGGSPSIRKSRIGPWRAAVLIGVHALIAAHIVQWIVSGMADGRRQTISPVEPSESMWTLEQGTINAGFVMFVIAIASTLVLGRWFCGWACHIVALQDLCGWLMKKVGVHPKPWRSRLLVWFPLGLACYMFLWPTFRRVVLAPLLAEKSVEIIDGVERTRLFFPPSLHFLGQPIPFPSEGLRTHFMVEDFWATFPPWYIAVPYFLVCGFAAVYFLGAKGFCTYGCPYGGFFGPADRLSPLRIRVSDDCNHCGHCTAVCTSNVRVSDEVRDYGAVVDPGCMKCLDCVSVCPTGALSASFGLPAILTRPRVAPPDRGVTRKRLAALYDLSWPEELFAATVMIVTFIGFRGTTLFDWSIPMLMAGGVGAVAAFVAFKLWRMVRDLNVRGPRMQLKKGGKVTPVGWCFAFAGAIFLTLGALAFVTQMCQAVASAKHSEIERTVFKGLGLAASNAKREELLSTSYRPDPALAAAAQDAIKWYQRADGIHKGGWGLNREWDETGRMAWLHLVAGEADKAESSFKRMLEQRDPDDGSVLDVAALMQRRGAPPEEAERYLRQQLARKPQLHAVRATLAGVLSFQAQQASLPDQQGQPRDAALAEKKNKDAVDILVDGVKAMPGDLAGIESAFSALLAGGRADKVSELLPLAIKARPKAATLFAWKGALAIFAAGGPDRASQAVKAEAEQAVNEAAALVHDDEFTTMNKLSQIMQWVGKPDDAKKWQERAAAAAKKAGIR